MAKYLIGLILGRDMLQDERKIVFVKKGSSAWRSGVKVGDIVLSVNGHRVDDRLDFLFATKDESDIELEIERDGKILSVHLKANNGDFGIEIAPLKIRRCTNKCVFCFVDQMPPGLRSSLYVKDEDFRFSFLEGSYITMTNLTERDWERIIRQRMSPLYISVHSTDEEVRKKLLGKNNVPPIMAQLERLANGGVNFHAQIVVVPGYNDGTVLEKTVSDLLSFGDALLSLAVVPVGLTKHRDRLAPLKPVSRRLAKEIVDWHYEVRDRNDTARRTLQLADEFFLLAECDIPQESYYNGYPQYENGVGMVRYFIERARLWGKDNFPDLSGIKLAVVTGRLFAPIFESIALERLESLTGAKISVLAPVNSLFGASVTVANLLPAIDVVRAIKSLAGKPDAVLIPPRIMSSDGLSLEDWTLEVLEREIDSKVIVAPEDVSELGSILTRELSVG